MTKTKNERYALITGAGSGLGRCYALELADLGINTILVDLPSDNLDATVEQSRSRGVECIGLGYDLTDNDHLSMLCREVNERYPLYLLINNVGAGGTKRFTECDTEYLDRIINLNVRVTTILTHELLTNLNRAPKSYILNVSSMAAFSPIAYKTIYPASKSYIQYFTHGLYEELRRTNIFVSVVNPGPMYTNADVKRRIELQGIFGRLGASSPEEVARYSLRQLFRHNTVIMLGTINRLNWLLMHLVPQFICVPLVSHVVKRELQIDKQ